MSGSSPSFDFDAVVVGAGVVGLAIGQALARAGQSVVVLEKERAIGQGVSSRNSEVIHAGLYYPTGSLRARLCVAGRRLLYPFLESHGVAHRRLGKLVVASDDSDLARLEAVAAQARLNGVEDLETLSGDQARTLEPALRARAALLSPQTGVVDSHGYMLALRGEIEDHGGAVAVAAPFIGAEPLAGGGFAVRVGGAEPARLLCSRLVIAAGLGAQSAAAEVEGYPADQIPALHYGKGMYFALDAPAPFQRLVYPPPIPGALGVHYTLDLGGRARFGPDLSFVAAEDYSVDPSRREGFAVQIRRFWPGLPEDALRPDYAGVRPKLHGPGEPQPDFRIDDAARHGLDGLVALFGIESPGLTSALAIADEVAARLGLA